MDAKAHVASGVASRASGVDDSGVELPAPLAGGKYLFISRLGAGGFGAVWRGLQVQSRLRKVVAIKLLRPELVRNPDWRSFGNDTLAARLRSPHIADVYEIVEENDRCAIIMEFLEGRSLKQRLVDLGPLSPASTLRVARAVAEALLAAHRARVVHRDIKPGNIMVGAAPEIAEDDIKIIDWGLALGVPRWGLDRADEGDVTSHEIESVDDRLRFAGTKEYMSPERFAGVIDRQADIWAYGCVLYECLTGRRAFSGPDVIEKINGGHVDFGSLPPQTPEALRRLITMCLRPEPSRRLLDMAGALALIDGESDCMAVGRPRTVPDLLPPLLSDEKEVARPALVNEVATAVARAPLVALSGPYGCGKSWVALKVAREALACAQRGDGPFAGGVGMIDLRGVSEISQLPRRIAALLAELGSVVSVSADIASLQRVLQQRAERGMLLVLDDADGVLRELPTLLAQLRAPGLHVLVTARRSPGTAGWVVHPVELLESPPEQGVQSETSIQAYDAVQLFVKRARATWKQFTLDATNVDSVAAICRRVGGLPRAIELVAVRIRFDTPQEILERLMHFLQPLVTAPAHDTMTRTVAWSIDSASPDERLLLERLSIFEGSWTLASVEAVCCDERLPQSAVHELLNGLIEQALVQAERSPRRPRYRLLEVERELCRRRFEVPERRDDLAALRRRHLQRFEVLVLPPDSPAATRKRSLSRRNEQVDLRHEDADCCAAIRFALSDPSALETAVDIAVEMQEYWYDRGRYEEGLRLLTPLLAAWGERGDVRHVRLLAARAKLVWRSDPRAACDGYRAALALQRRIVAETSGEHLRAERARLAAILHNIALSALQLFDVESSRSTLAESRVISREIESSSGEAVTHLTGAILDVFEGRIDEAEANLDVALPAFHEAEDSMRIGTVYLYRGRIALLRGDLASAQRWCRDSLTLRMKTDEPEGVAESIRFAGEIAAGMGKPARAASMFGAAHRRRESLGIDVQATDAATYESCLQRVRRELSQDEFDCAWDRGESLSDEEAAEMAFTGMGE